MKRIEPNIWNKNIRKFYDIITRSVLEEHVTLTFSFQNRVGDCGSINCTVKDNFKNYIVRFLHCDANGKPILFDTKFMYSEIEIIWEEHHGVIHIYWDDDLIFTKSNISINKFKMGIDNFCLYDYDLSENNDLKYRGIPQKNWLQC